MEWYIENAINIILDNNTDPDLLLMAKTTIKEELKKIEPYILECNYKGVEPVESINENYKKLKLCNHKQ